MRELTPTLCQVLLDVQAQAGVAITSIDCENDDALLKALSAMDTATSSIRTLISLQVNNPF